MGIETELSKLKYRRTKIVATLGPSSRTREAISALIRAGANVFRLNMSHGTHDDHRATYRNVREAAEAEGVTVAVMADLCGPKIRVGRFEGDSIPLEEGARVTVTTRDVIGKPGLVPSKYAALARDVKSQDRLLLDDGRLELRVESVEGQDIACTVITGGTLKNNKGMNLPGVDVSAPSLTKKDRRDADFALELGVDYLALSFVRCGEDVAELRAIVDKVDEHVGIISKIEKPEALERIDDILTASDGIMVARGDLGVELPPQHVPIIQDQLIDLARDHNKPVIVATQMLESMMDCPRPTRAEVTDVANAVRYGADAVMLSGETAAGQYPVEAVAMMDTIARQSEGYLWSQGAFRTIQRSHDQARPLPIEDALAESTAQLSRDLLVRSIVVLTHWGRSAAVTSASRPAAPVVAVSPVRKASCRAALLWGVIPFYASVEDMSAPEDLARKAVRTLKTATEGQTILVVKGFSADPSKNAPSVTVVTV